MKFLLILQTQHKYRSDAAVYARRIRIGKYINISIYNTFRNFQHFNFLRGDKNLLQKAKWKTKTYNIISKNIVTDSL